MRKYFYLSTVLLICLFSLASMMSVPMAVQAIDEVTPTPSADSPTESPRISPTPVPEATSDEIDVQALIDDAITDLQEGRYRAAIAKMDSVIEVAPDNTTAYLLRGIAHVQLSQYKAAIDDFSTAIEFEPWNMDSYVWRGDTYALDGELTDALLDYDEAIAINPHVAGLFSRRSEIYFQLGDNVAGDTDDLISRGLDSATSGDTSTAIDLLTEAIDSANTDSARGSAYYSRGMMYYGTDANTAIEDLKLAVEADPKLDNAYLVLGILYRENGDIAAAGQALYQRIITNGTETMNEESSVGESLDVEMAYRRVYAISFEGQAGQVVTITARDTDFTAVDPLIALVAPDGEAIAGDDDFGGNLDSMIDNFELPQDGTYTLYVSHAEGGYDFGFQGIVHVTIDG